MATTSQLTADGLLRDNNKTIFDLLKENFMAINIAGCKQALSMPLLLGKLGYGDRAKRSARCIFHEDKNPSFGIFNSNNGWRFKCFSCGESGDEIDMIQKALGMDKATAIRHYAELAGVKDNGNGMTPGAFMSEAAKLFNATPVSENNLSGGDHSSEGRRQVEAATVEASALNNCAPPAQLSPLTPKQARRVAEWRGYSTDFVDELSERGLIGTFTVTPQIAGQMMGVTPGTYIAVPAENGCHFRVKDGSWRYTKGSKVALFTTGAIEEGANIHVFESPWDGFAYMEASGEWDNIAITKGSQNGGLLKRFKGHTGTLYLWKQNDKPDPMTGVRPGDKWAEDIRKLLPDEQIKLVTILAPVKDLNEWRNMKHATDGDIFNAMLDARDYAQSTLVSSANNFPVVTQEPVALPNGKYRVVSAVVDSGENNSLVTGAEPGFASNRMVDSEPVATGTVAISGELDKEPHHQPTDKAIQRVSGISVVGDTGSHVSASVAAPLSQTLDEAVAFLKRYVVFAHEGQAELCALWIAHTYVFERFSNTPYLHICSPEQNCGKSTVLKCLRALARKPEKLSNTSEAAMFRVIDMEKPTLLCDEVDNIFADEKANKALIGILNDGYEEGGTVIRCEDYGRGIGRFNVYCPKAFTGIGKIPSTLQSRCIDIRLKRQTAEHKAEPCRMSKIKNEGESISKRLEAWANNAVFGDTNFPEALSDGRLQDMAEPLLAVADLAGGEWPTAARGVLTRVMREGLEQSYGTRLLADCSKVFGYQYSLTEEDMMNGLIKITTSPWARWWEKDAKYSTKAALSKLADMLSPYGITPKDDSYERPSFYEAWKTYIPDMELGL